MLLYYNYCCITILTIIIWSILLLTDENKEPGHEKLQRLQEAHRGRYNFIVLCPTYYFKIKLFSGLGSATAITDWKLGVLM